MARTKRLTQVAVKTLPNGYALTVGDREYMAFNESELAGEIFLHVALGEKQNADREYAANIVEAVANWDSIKDVMNNAALTASQNRRQIHDNKRRQMRLDELEDEVDELRKKVRLFVTENAILQNKVANLENLRNSSNEFERLLSLKEKQYSDIYKELKKAKAKLKQYESARDTYKDNTEELELRRAREEEQQRKNQELIKRKSEYDKEYYATVRKKRLATMPDEEVEKRRERQRKAYQKRKARMTEEDREKRRAYMRDRYYRMTEEERKKYNARQRERYKRKTLSCDE